MGAYLSQPKTDKASTDESNEYMSVGSSSMQGWRNSQEDAHNSILNFDTNTAFFAVYDGHGGAEVSTYCADKLPNFLKSLATYMNGNFEQALLDTFLGFDKTLLEPEIIETLKVLAGEKNFVDGDDSDVMEEDEDENLAELHEEGNLPLDEVMEKYKGHPSMPSLKKLKESNNSKPQSPYLRGRRAAAVIADAANRAELDPDLKPEGSSTSKAALALKDGPTSSKSLSLANKLETEDDSTVSSSSSRASKSNNVNNSNRNITDADATGAASTTTTELTSESTTNGKSTDEIVPDSSALKEIDHNGGVSSSEVKNKDEASSSSNKEDSTVSGSSDVNIKEHKQNGNVESSGKSSMKQEANSSTITSTSKDVKKIKITEEEDGRDFEGNESTVRHALEYSSEEELGDEDTTDEDADYDDDDDDEIEEDDEEVEEDEESYLANEQFCANMIEEPGKDSGCTAVVSLLNGRDLYVANAGDSRCVICRNGKAIEMSLDHKPEDDEESSRIVKAGGRVTLDGRVNGGLNLSRALGDHAYKMNHDLPADEQMISALPDIKKLIISPDDEFMILACDGIWNFMTSEEVVDFVRSRISDETKKISKICEELFEACLAPNTLGDGTGCDNMTAVIVRFKPSILELPTKINSNDTEDVLLLEAEKSGQKAQKRAASPTSDENDSNGAKNNKRLKTETIDKENKTYSSSVAKTNSLSSTSSTMSANITDVATTAINDESSSTTANKKSQNESDSVVASST